MVGVSPVHAAPNAGLIGDHHDGNVPAVDGGDGFGDAREHDQILGVVKILALFVDHPVPIEKQARSQVAPLKTEYSTH